MIPVKLIFDSVNRDYVNSAENGHLSFEMFNRLSLRAETRLMDYISGDVENVKPPFLYTSQKVKDYLSSFIAKKPLEVSDGRILKPKDYYGFENLYLLGDFDVNDCKEYIPTEKLNPIELLGGAAFAARTKSYIVGLAPSFDTPIAKMVGDGFEFAPSDLGSVVLEYIRYPKFAKIVSKKDEEYNYLVIDEAKSENYEYGEWAIDFLIYFIGRAFAVSTREGALLQSSQFVGKTVRDEK